MGKITALDSINKLITLDEESPKRILVIGDIMTDIYIHGRVEQCQEGCPKFIEESAVIVPGGAANAARSLKNWNTEVVLFPILSKGWQLEFPIKRRYMEGNRCVFRHDDDSCVLDMSYARNIITDVLHEMKVDAVLLSDYDKGFLTPEFIRKIIDSCNQRNIPCIADVKREPELYGGAVIKCNEEYQRKYNKSLSCLVHDSDMPYNLVVTAGQLTPIIWYEGELQKGFKTLPPVQCVNHVGAGDCFAVHLTLALSHGFSLKESAEIAYSAGRVYVQHRHNKPPCLDEIRADVI